MHGLDGDLASLSQVNADDGGFVDTALGPIEVFQEHVNGDDIVRQSLERTSHRGGDELVPRHVLAMEPGDLILGSTSSGQTPRRRLTASPGVATLGVLLA